MVGESFGGVVDDEDIAEDENGEDVCCSYTNEPEVVSDESFFDEIHVEHGGEDGHDGGVEALAEDEPSCGGEEFWWDVEGGDEGEDDAEGDDGEDGADDCDLAYCGVVFFECLLV